MPDVKVDPTAFPTFPTQFTEDDRKRFEDLAVQKRQMDEIYQQKFTPSAWSGMNLPEKALRKYLPEWSAPAVSAVLPWKLGFDYGYTPEQAQVAHVEFGQVFKELARKEKVVRLLPNIQKDIVMAALIKQPFENLNVFPEIDEDFTVEEKQYITDFMAAVRHADIDDILSGKVYEAATLPITEEQLRSFAGEYNSLDSRLILSTVAFSKDMSEVSKALLQAFPPDVTLGEDGIPTNTQERLDAMVEAWRRENNIPTELAPEAQEIINSWLTAHEYSLQMRLSETEKQKILRDYFDSQVKKLPEGMEDTTTVSEDITRFDLLGEVKTSHAGIKAREGSLLTLTNTETGELFTAQRKADNSVELNGEMVGFWDEETSKLLPVDYNGEPVTGDPSFLEKIKASYNSFFLGAASMMYGTEQSFLRQVPLAFLSDKEIKSFADVEGLTEKQIKALDERYLDKLPPEKQRVRDSIIEAAREEADKKELIYREFLDSNPQFAPPVQWQGTVIDAYHRDPTTLLDPMYGIFVFSQSAMYSLSFLGVSSAVGYATKNPYLGLMVGAAVTAPSQSYDLYLDLLEAGVPEVKAATIGVEIGAVISSVEILGGMPVMKSLMPALFKNFGRRATKEAIKLTMKRLALRGIKNFTVMQFSEVFEEVLQQAIQNATVAYYDDTREILTGMPEVIAQSWMASLPMSWLGVGGDLRINRHYLGQNFVTQLNDTQRKLIEAGLEAEHAEAVAYSVTLQSEKNRASFEKAIDKTIKENPSPEQIASRQKVLTSLQKATDRDLTKFFLKEETEIKLAERLEKEGDNEGAKQARVRATVANELLIDIIKRRDVITKQLGILENAPSVRLTEPAAEPTPELPAQIEVEAKRYTPAEESVEPTQPSQYIPPSVSIGELNRLTTGQVPTEAVKPTDAASAILTEKQVVVTDIIFSKQKDFWNKSIRGVKEAVIEAAGISKTALNNSWENLTSIQRDLLGKVIDTYSSQTEEIAGIKQQIEDILTTESGVVMAVTPDGRERIQDWEDEIGNIYAALEARPDIAAGLKESSDLKSRAYIAERSWINSDAETRKDQAKAAGIRLSSISEDWGNLTPDEKGFLTLASFEDGSISWNRARSWFDMRYQMQFLEEKTGLPFCILFKRIEMSNGAARIVKENFLKEIGENPLFKHVITDKESLIRVAQYINSKNPEANVAPPESLSVEEATLAEVIQNIYKEYEPKIRYLRVMRCNSTLEAMKEMFPDAVKAGLESELEEALSYKNLGDKEQLYNYLADKTWGVIGTGFDPWIITNRSLKKSKTKLSSARGRGRLERRETIDYDEAGLADNILMRLATYLEQLEIQWRIEPELDKLNELFIQSEGKFKDSKHLEEDLTEWTKEIQGMATPKNWIDRILSRIWRQAMSSVFLAPFMPVRNFHQFIFFHPDRKEFINRRGKKITPTQQVLSNIYYESFASQLKSIRRDWLYTGQKGVLDAIKLGWINRLSDKMNLYSHSDNIPRRWSFNASFRKANAASIRFAKDGNIERWLKKSGAEHLRNSEQNYALKLLAQESHNLGIAGLHNISGSNMANLFIAHEIANMTHFAYERKFRGSVEMGVSGRTLFNLMVFPRGYSQRLLLQADKIWGKVKGKEHTTWEQARSGFKDIMLLIIIGTMGGEWLKDLTGKTRNSYTPTEIIPWELGGLFVGVGVDITALLKDLVRSFDFTCDADMRKAAQARVPTQASSLTRTMVPFYMNVIATIEAVTDKRNIDTQWLRKLRAFLDDNYTPQEQDDANRDLWEKIQKALFDVEPPDPNVFEKIQTQLKEEQERLGDMDESGNFYTTQDFGAAVHTQTEPLSISLLTEQEGFSALAVFYIECEDKWQELYTLPSKERTAWRKTHIEEEASLIFWGKYSSIKAENRENENEIIALLELWVDIYGLDQRQFPKLATIAIPPK